MTHYSSVGVRHAERAFLVPYLFLSPLSPSIQNLLIITLIFVLNNMPPAHFLASSPPSFIHLSLPRSERLHFCAVFHTYSDNSRHPHLSLQLLPSVFSHFVLPCVHFSDLVTPSPPVCRHTVLFFLCSLHTHKKDIKAVKTQQLPRSPSPCVCVSVSAVCTVAGLFDCLQVLVLVCHHSAVFTVHAPSQCRIIRRCCLCAFVHSRASDWITYFNCK